MVSVRRTSTKRKAAAMAAAAPAGVSTVHGIDVAIYQNTVDWRQVVTQPTAQGQKIGFAYIKATEGSTIVDPCFAANWRDSKGLLPRGAYHFFYATVDPRLQAENFINTLRRGLDAAGEDMPELPPAVDVEVGFPPELSVDQATASLHTVLSMIEQAFGKRPIIYTASWFWVPYMADTRVFSQDYLLWVATYGPQISQFEYALATGDPVIPGGWSDYAIWQNAVLTGVAGIGASVDRNVIRLPAGKTVVDFLNRSSGQEPPDDLKTALTQHAQAEECLQFTLDDRLFKQIVADGCAPNSPEFPIKLRVRRAERLDGDEVRVYFTADDGDQVSFVVRPGVSSQGAEDPLRDFVIAAAEGKLALGFNKNAGLQTRIHDDGYLPISGEFSLDSGGASYAGQAAQHPATGQKRVYYAQAPNWGYVQFIEY